MGAHFPKDASHALYWTVHRSGREGKGILYSTPGRQHYSKIFILPRTTGEWTIVNHKLQTFLSSIFLGSSNFSVPLLNLSTRHKLAKLVSVDTLADGLIDCESIWFLRCCGSGSGIRDPMLYWSWIMEKIRQFSVADPDPRSAAFSTLNSGVKKTGSAQPWL